MNNEERRQEYRVLYFGPFRLDVRNAQLWQGPEVIRLTSKALAVLCYLAERSGRLVTKDELFTAVWPGVVVSDSALVTCISELRRALGDERRTPHFIETVHGRGYRFLAPVSSSAQPVSSSAFQVSSSQPAPALPLPDKPSIAVLPFINMSGDLEQEYFSDGMTEDLITDLSKLSGLFVIARNSSFYYKYKGKAVKIEEVGKELGVQYVLEGSVRKADSQVRITAQLVDATTSCHLWAERYDRALQDIFALQDDIRQKIVTALRVKLLPEEQERLKYFPTNNLEAYDYGLRGEAYYYCFTKETNAQARRMLERAIELDPQYAAAYAALGMNYYTDWIFLWSDSPQTIEQAFALARRAVTLNDSLSMAHQLVGWAYLHRQQYEQAIAEEERALALAPHAIFGHIGLGFVLICVGRLEEAIELAERAIRLDPHYVGRYAFDLGHAYYLLRRYAEALAALQKTLIWNPNFLPAHGLLAAVYSELGREEEARAEIAETLRINPNNSLEGRRQRMSYKDPAVAERLLTALRTAGLK